MPNDTSVNDPIPEAGPARKKPRRLWLFAPYVFIAVLALAYGAWWFVVTARIAAGLDAHAAALRSAGYTVELGPPRIDGFPFRLKVSLSEARIAAPSGWAISAPGLVGEAYLHDPGHWVLSAPQGLLVTRPQGGGLMIAGQALRASIAGVSQIPWRIVLEGTKLTFTPGPGARPFSLASADKIDAYLQPTPDGAEGMTLVRLEGGKAAADTLLHRIAGDAVVAGSLEARLSKPGAFRGQGWGEAVRAWSQAGGTAEAVNATVTAGKASALALGGTLAVDADGRLLGALPLQLKQAGPALGALADSQALDAATANSAAAVAAARAQDATANINLVFQAGAATLGPVRIGPSPKVG